MPSPAPLLSHEDCQTTTIKTLAEAQNGVELPGILSMLFLGDLRKDLFCDVSQGEKVGGLPGRSIACRYIAARGEKMWAVRYLDDQVVGDTLES